MTTARAVARDALVRVEGGAYAHIVVPQLLRAGSLSLRDRAMVTDLVYGTVREQRRLDDLLRPFGKRTVRSLDPPVRASLRMGAHQLVHGTPAHAAVSEAVEVAPQRARGYVNAVLRALASAGPPWPDASSPAVMLSYPDWIVEQLTRDLGSDDALAALEASNEPPGVALRPNLLRTTTAELRDELEATGSQVSTGSLCTDALVIRGAGDMMTLPAVAEGRATPQDEASQAIVDVLGPELGERVLDVAAAPGGKTTGIAERVGDDGYVAAADARVGRLSLVRSAVARLGLANVRIVASDGRALPFADASFDRVLVDAPCTGLGVLRRRPDARWRIQQEDVAQVADLQLALIVGASAAVRSGGVLVYSVCTLTAPETIGVAERALRALPGFTPDVAPGPPWRPHGEGALLLPQDVGTDGMFVLRLRRA